MRRFDYENDDDYAFLMMLALVSATILMCVAFWFIAT